MAKNEPKKIKGIEIGKIKGRSIVNYLKDVLSEFMSFSNELNNPALKTLQIYCQNLVNAISKSLTDVSNASKLNDDAAFKVACVKAKKRLQKKLDDFLRIYNGIKTMGTEAEVLKGKKNDIKKLNELLLKAANLTDPKTFKADQKTTSVMDNLLDSLRDFRMADLMAPQLGDKSNTSKSLLNFKNAVSNMGEPEKWGKK